MLDTVIIHVYWVFLYTIFQRMQPHGQNGHVFDRWYRGDFPLHSRRPFVLSRPRGLRTHVTEQAGGRWPTNSTKKNADSGACSHSVHDCSSFCLADISQAKNGEIQIVVYFTRLRCTHNPCLSTWLTFALFLPYENPANCSLYRILITEINHLLWRSSPFLSWPMSWTARNLCRILA